MIDNYQFYEGIIVGIGLSLSWPFILDILTLLKIAVLKLFEYFSDYENQAAPLWFLAIGISIHFARFK